MVGCVFVFLRFLMQRLALSPSLCCVCWFGVLVCLALLCVCWASVAHYYASSWECLGALFSFLLPFTLLGCCVLCVFACVACSGCWAVFRASRCEVLLTMLVWCFRSLGLLPFGVAEVPVTFYPWLGVLS